MNDNDDTLDSPLLLSVVIDNGNEQDEDESIVSRALLHCTSFSWRLREEWYLWRKQWMYIVASFIVLFYGTMCVFLNLAFYRMEIPVAKSRLKDLGHEIIPPMSKSLADAPIVDMPMNFIFLIVGLMLFSVLNNNTDAGKRNPKPHFVNMIRRGSSVVAIGHLLRACTYLSTSIPGSADHCLADAHPEEYQPKTIIECFYRMGDPYHNCGDLMFSGHLLLAITMVLTVDYYGESAFWTSQKMNRALVILCFGLLVLESILILSARHHYTSDVVVAWYFTPLLWYYYNTAIQPHDMKPDLCHIAKHVLDDHNNR